MRLCTPWPEPRKSLARHEETNDTLRNEESKVVHSLPIIPCLLVLAIGPACTFCAKFRSNIISHQKSSYIMPIQLIKMSMNALLYPRLARAKKINNRYMVPLLLAVFGRKQVFVYTGGNREESICSQKGFSCREGRRVVERRSGI